MLLQILRLLVDLKQTLSCNVLILPLFSKDNVTLWVIGAEVVEIFLCEVQLYKQMRRNYKKKTFFVVVVAPIQKLDKGIISRTRSKK